MAKEKVASIEDAVALVRDGDVVAIQNMATQLAPMALVRELIRQGQKDLSAVVLVGGMCIDWLSASGQLKELIGAAVSMEQFGLCNRYRKAVESQQVKVEELSETALLARLGAGARGLPFLPSKGLIGTQLIDLSDNLKLIDDPFGSGQKIVACKALVPDVALVHAHRADKYGNIQMEPTAIWPDLGIFPKAAKTVIVSVEEIVDTAVLRRNPDRTVLPGFIVDAVVEVPYGAHPTSCNPMYGYDGGFHREWSKAARDDDATRAFLDKYVRTPKTQADYLDAVGGATKLMALNTWEA